VLRPAPRTHRHTHSHAHPDPRTRGGPPRPLLAATASLLAFSIPRSLRGFVVGFLFFFFNFPFALAGLPLAPGRAGSSLGRIFPDLQCPPRGGGGKGWPAWLLRPGFSREPSPGAHRAMARTPMPLGSGCGQEPSMPALAGPLALPAPRPGPPIGLRRPGLASLASAAWPCCHWEVYLVLVAELRAYGARSVPPLPHSHTPILPTSEMGCLWGFGAVRSWRFESRRNTLGLLPV
jgi:hypothetical protein